MQVVFPEPDGPTMEEGTVRSVVVVGPADRQAAEHPLGPHRQLGDPPADALCHHAGEGGQDVGPAPAPAGMVVVPPPDVVGQERGQLVEALVPIGPAQPFGQRAAIAPDLRHLESLARLGPAKPRLVLPAPTSGSLLSDQPPGPDARPGRPSGVIRENLEPGVAIPWTRAKISGRPATPLWSFAPEPGVVGHTADPLGPVCRAVLGAVGGRTRRDTCQSPRKTPSCWTGR